ncbi:MAG: hypothetical protein K6G54_02430 [Oscillospiraceae bacterium]|nr:hypothetical protein [Oscillospiraceae bacterium]
MNNSGRNNLPPQSATLNSEACRKWIESRRQESASATTEAQWSSGPDGYGVGLIAADEASQERIKAIMREICEREKRAATKEAAAAPAPEHRKA